MILELHEGVKVLEKNSTFFGSCCHILMIITQDEKCHNDGVARPPIRDNDHKRKRNIRDTQRYKKYRVYQVKCNITK